MFIQTETTPNPETLKFIPGVTVLDEGSATFINAGEAKNSPLAEEIFKIPAVKSVYLGNDFISITKIPESNWSLLKPALLNAIMEHFVSGRPTLLNKENKVENATKVDESEIVKQIKELIETRVRPAVAQDGGDIVFRSFNDGIVELELHGSCSGCPSSTATLKDGIENMLKHYVPEVLAVEAVS